MTDTSVRPLSPFKMCSALAEYNFREPLGYVSYVIDQLSLKKLEADEKMQAPKWFNMPFHLTLMYHECKHGKLAQHLPHAPNSFVAIDLNSSKKKILKDFEKLLDQQKIDSKSTDSRKRYRRAKTSDWVNCFVLAL